MTNPNQHSPGSGLSDGAVLAVGLLPPDALASLSLADMTNSFTFPSAGNGNSRGQWTFGEGGGGRDNSAADNLENIPPNRIHRLGSKNLNFGF